jgi:inorganic pyrophosphatase
LGGSDTSSDDDDEEDVAEALDEYLDNGVVVHLQEGEVDP